MFTTGSQDSLCYNINRVSEHQQMDCGFNGCFVRVTHIHKDAHAHTKACRRRHTHSCQWLAAYLWWSACLSIIVGAERLSSNWKVNVSNESRTAPDEMPPFIIRNYYRNYKCIHFSKQVLVLIGALYFLLVVLTLRVLVMPLPWGTDRWPQGSRSFCWVSFSKKRPQNTQKALSPATR